MHVIQKILWNYNLDYCTISEQEWKLNLYLYVCEPPHKTDAGRVHFLIEMCTPMKFLRSLDTLVLDRYIKILQQYSFINIEVSDVTV